MIKQICADQLRLGMCVCGVGRQTGDSSYHHNQFVIKDQHELDYLLSLSKVFYIDTEQGLDVLASSHPQEKDFAYYLQAYLLLLPRLDALYAGLKMGKALDFAAAKNINQDLMRLVIDNPVAMIGSCWEPLEQEPANELSRKSLNVAVFSLALGWRLGVSTVEVFNLGLGALLHDIGITQLPEALLNKQAPLTADERAIMEHHTLYGLKLLASQKSVPADVKKIVYQHHERFDGQGYPGKLKGEAIDLAARLIGMTSVFEALTRDRVYSRCLTPENAIQFLHASGNTLFDQRLIDQFIGVLGVYPKGAVVELSSGHLAVVSEVNLDDRLAPKLRLLTDEHKNLLDELTLSDEESASHLQASILKILDKNEPILPFLQLYRQQSGL